MQTPRYASLEAIQQDLQNGQISLVELVQYYLDQIAAQKELNCYVEVFAEEALQQAAQLDEARAKGTDLGCLHGMVLSIKDVICYAGHQVTAGSKILEGFTSLFTSTAVERLLAEGAIIIGRTNCDEFAMGSTNENSHYGPVLNAADPSRVPGGSSGGAAVSVQADTCLAALGSDTGGSVRQPAGFCGVIGMKPSYGRISRHGLLAYGSSFDQIGTISHSIADAAILLEIMAGADEFDATCVNKKVDAYSKLAPKKQQYRIAYLSAAMDHPSLDPEVKTLTEDRMEQWKKAGHQVEPVDFPLLDYIIPAYYVLTTAEASSNLSRYDGLRYGFRHPEAKDLQDTYQLSRTEGFGTEVKRRIMLGAFVLSAGYYDAYYSQAQKVRRLIRDQLNSIYADYDFVCLPVAPGPAFKLGETTDDPVAMYLADIFTVAANMTGVPAVSFPIGIHQASQMPIGLQLMAPAFAEAELLAFANLQD